MTKIKVIDFVHYSPYLLYGQIGKGIHRIDSPLTRSPHEKNSFPLLLCCS